MTRVIDTIIGNDEGSRLVRFINLAKLEILIGSFGDVEHFTSGQYWMGQKAWNFVVNEL